MCHLPYSYDAASPLVINFLPNKVKSQSYNRKGEQKVRKIIYYLALFQLFVK